MSAPLRTIVAADLPPLAYAHDGAVDMAHVAFRPVQGDGWVKPHAGTGLWASPVTATNEDGTPADTAWLEWCRAEWDATGYTKLTEILPGPGARVLLIDGAADLAALVDMHPASYPLLAGSALDNRYPDWEALAAAGWDAVYLTDRGQWETRLPPRGPNLYGWDMPSVLWLHPAYAVGRTTVVRPLAAEAGDPR